MAIREASGARGVGGHVGIGPLGLTQEQILQDVVPDMVNRIVAVVHPLRVILFGSAARGTMGPDSDLDVLVVVPDGTDRRGMYKAVYRSLRGLGFATDALLISESELVAHGGDSWLVYQEVLADGIEVYRA